MKNETALEMCLRHKKEREEIEKLCEPEILTRVRKLHEGEEPEFNQDDVIRKAATGDENAYLMYNREQKTEHIDMYKNAQTEIRKCLDEYDDIAAKTIQKAGETDEQREARIWQQNPGLYDRLSNAQSTLANLQKAGR